MIDEVKKYEIITNTSTRLIIGKTIVFTIIFCISVYLNLILNINKVWAFCGLFLILTLYISCIILHITSLFRVGTFNESNIKKKNNHKSNLILSANIIFLICISLNLVYMLLSVILFA